MHHKRWICQRKTCDGLPHDGCQVYHSRTQQRPPEGAWGVWYLRGGRGSGKTRAGGETLGGWVTNSEPLPSGEQSEWAIVAPTFGDARDICMEGPSGLIRALGGRESPLIANWNRSIGELYLTNGSKVYIDGADDGALRIQGKNLRGTWCDEIGLWRDWDTAWNESLAFAIRLDPAKTIATGTPKTGHPLVRYLLNDPQTVVTHMRMIDNIANLHPDRVAALRKRWEGTRRGRQELDGEFLEDVVGALWTLSVIDRFRVDAAPTLDRIVVGVDPSGAADEDSGSNEIGIVVVGFSVHEQHAYVIGDYSLRGGPLEWASAVVRAYKQFKADAVVVEDNYGGEMVRHTINSVDKSAYVKRVNAAKGKAVRAEPIVGLYEQGRVHHVKTWAELEEQMCHWVPPKPGERTRDSPDRMDALVWALTDLMIDKADGTQYATEDFGEEPVYRRGGLVLRGERYIDKV